MASGPPASSTTSAYDSAGDPYIVDGLPSNIVGVMPPEFRDFFKTHYGPTVAAYRGIADEPDRVAALDADLAALARRHDLGGGAMAWEYLLLTATTVQ